MDAMSQYHVFLNVVCSHTLAGLGALESMNGLFQLQLVLISVDRRDILSCSEGVCFARVVCMV